MRFIKYSSLEVVLGAVSYQYFIYYVYFGSFPPRVEGCLLALSVWFIYLIDRQIDNLFMPSQDERHYFHEENKRLLRSIIGLLAFVILLLLPEAKAEVLFAGALLAAFVLVYGFAWHKGWLRVEKELVTALLYGLGVGLVTWVKEPHSFLLVCALVALAYQNLCFFTLLENPSSFYKTRLRQTEWGIMGLIAGIFAAYQDFFMVLPFLVTFGITFILSRIPSTEKLRIWGDLAFWSPLIYLLHGIFSK